MNSLIDGKTLSIEVLDQAKTLAQALARPPKLAVILVGDNPDSLLYVSKKQQAAKEVGIDFVFNHLEEDSNFQKVESVIRSYNNDKEVDAVLLQLPLPKHLDMKRDELLSMIDPIKDVDGLHQSNIANFINNPGARKPVLISSILHLIKKTDVKLAGKRAVIFGNTDAFSKPLSAALERLGLKSIEWVGNNPSNPRAKELLKIADLVVTIVGRPGMITGSMIKKGAIVIDVGTSRINNKTFGDVDMQSVLPVAGCLTPVPGGVGPMTVAYLLLTTAKISSERQVL